MKAKLGGRRADAGVLARIEISEDQVRLVLEDVEHDGTGEPTAWRMVRLFTDNEYRGHRFADRTLSSKEYQELGFNIVNRLCALKGLEPAEQATARARRRRK